MLATPVPLTGDFYTALQGYSMNMKIEHIEKMEVLVSTISIEREFLHFILSQ